MNPYYPKLFEPITINGQRFRNRIWSAPNMMSHMGYDGRPDDSMIDYYREKALGGCAVVTVGDTAIDRQHAATNPRSYACNEENMPKIAELAKAIHEGGAIASHEINHGGRVALKEANFGDDSWVAWGPSDETRWDGQKVHGMTKEELELVADHYADAAELIKGAGFDMVLIHGGHGWLLDQFLSPLYNKRTDEFGGSLENRARFPLMVIDRVRERVGKRFLIEYRMSGSEEIEGGLSKEDGIEFAKMIDGRVDIIHVSAGMDTEPEQAVHTHPTMFLPHGVNVHYAADIKAAGVKTPIITIGAISSPDFAEKILEEGKADIVALSRALIADPYFPNKAKHGQSEDIIPCLRCLDCLAGLHEGKCLSCAVNSRTAAEERYDRIHPAKKQLNVLVAGGGPAGMKAAITAFDRGHRVTLADNTDALGGLLKFTDYDDLKCDLMALKNYLVCQVNKRNINVLLNTEVTKEFVNKGGFDAVICATGSSPATPPVPGLEKAEHATTVYTKLEALGKKVAVLGGGLVGCETGYFLYEKGHEVTIIEMQNEIAPEANWMHKEGMRQAFESSNIVTKTSHKVLSIEDGAVICEDADGNEVKIEADSVVYAMGMRPNSAVIDELEESDVIDIIPAGDCLRPRKARQAMEEGFWAAVNLA